MAFRVPIVVLGAGTAGTFVMKALARAGLAGETLWLWRGAGE